jgi:hypothetical protein
MNTTMKTEELEKNCPPTPPPPFLEKTRKKMKAVEV